MQMLLMQHRDPSLRNYFIWGPYISSDNETAARQAADRYLAPNTSHYWTPTQKLAVDLAPVLRLPVGKTAWDVFLLYSRGALWDSALPRPHYWQHQLEILQGDPLDITLFDAHLTQALNSPGGR